VGLLVTIAIQQTELKDSRKEFRRSADALADQAVQMRRQIFEATFFQMLSIHNGIVDAVTFVNDDGSRAKGRSAFTGFFSALGKKYQEAKERAPAGRSDDTILFYAYKRFWHEHQAELEHYFRYLYNLVKYVANSDFVDGPYIKLVRAQLSDKELVLLFYNCTYANGEKFKEYVERFELLDNMPHQFLELRHRKLIAKKAFGNQARVRNPAD
jgi:hypothetical protein